MFAQTTSQVDGICREDVPNDDICVIFINHESNEKTRRIFNKVNRYAKPTSRGDNIITSEDDRSAIIARKLLSEGAPLGVKAKGSGDLIVDWKNNTLGARYYIFTKESIEEILNLQPKQGKAKPYQVKQVRVVILKYQMGGQDDASL